MPARTQVTVAILAGIAVVVLIVPLAVKAYRAATRPPVIITLPAGVTSSPRSSAGSSPAVAAPAEPSAAGVILVHVAGAVNRPGLYKFTVGERVNDAVRQAGGPLATADEDAVNLAEPLRDGEKVYIPAKGESGASGDNEIGRLSSVAAASAFHPKSNSEGTAAHAAKLTSPSQGRVDLNTASSDELQKLPGVGPAMAARILAARRQLGGFRKPDDLLNVSGIGPKKYAKLEPFVTTQ